MKNIFEKIYQKLDKTADKIPSDVDDKNRRLFYFVFLIIGPPAMILFGVNGLLQGDVVLFSSLMVLAVGVITGWFILLKQEKGLFVYRINAGVYAIILIYAVYLGGQGGSKILWSYTFPLIVIFLFGKKEGLLWCILYYLGVSAIIFPEWNLHSKHTYSSEFTLRFTFTFFMVSAITLWFEHLRSSYRNKLEFKNKSLEHQIIETQKVKSELQESEKLFRAIFDQASIGVSLTCSETGNLLKVNKKYCEIVGYTAKELEKINFQKLTHPDDLEQDLKGLEDLRNGKIDMYSMEKRQIHSDGSTIWVYLSVSPVWGKQGQRDRHIAIIKDITERKRLEAEIKTLEGIIPICSGCNKIRDDQGYWNLLESYIQTHSNANFSHSLCPDCMDKFYGDEDWYIKRVKGKDS